MEAGTSTATPVDAELPVKDVMTAMSEGVTELSVIDDGKPIGLIRAASLMRRLINPRQG